MLECSQLLYKIFSKVLITNRALLDSIYAILAVGSVGTVIPQKGDVS